MESIDVHDLPEGEAQLIAQLVELLKRRGHGAEADVKGATCQRKPLKGRVLLPSGSLG